MISANIEIYRCFTFTACSDPGIVLEDEDLALNSVETNSKFECGICNILRPRKASHCFECGFCVLELDHHCPVCIYCLDMPSILVYNTYILFYCAFSGLENVLDGRP